MRRSNVGANRLNIRLNPATLYFNRENKKSRRRHFACLQKCRLKAVQAAFHCGLS